MPIRFRCAYCSQLMGIARRKAGTVVKCPKCAGEIIVPTPEENEPEGVELPGNDGAEVQLDFGGSDSNTATATEPAPPIPALPLPPPPPPPPATRVGVFLSVGTLAISVVVVILLLILMFVLGLVIGKQTAGPAAQIANGARPS
jgi:phage FluMu protein Com